MARTSETRQAILQYLQDFLAENGYAPSVREIMQAVGLRSTASVQYHLTELQRCGQIHMDGNKKRAISLPGSAERTSYVPIVGVVTAGLPILAQENIEGYLPWEQSEDCFALRVRGDSMVGAGILDGDTVIVRRQQTADDGEIVVALLGDEATVKRLYRRRGEVLLLPENPAYEPLDGREAYILGKVKGVVRRY